MQMIIKKQIGKREYTFVVDGKTMYEVAMAAEDLSFSDVPKCGVEGCGSDNLVLTAYETKEDKFHYVKIKCLKCGGSLTFGQKKGTNTYYLRKKDDSKEYDWQAYVPKDAKGS